MPPSAISTATLSSQTTTVLPRRDDNANNIFHEKSIPASTNDHRYLSHWHRLKLKLKEHDPILTAMYLFLTWLCFSMVVWILISPASWLIDKSTFHRETLVPFLEKMGFMRLTPTIIVTKYQHHPAVHFTHLLPGALWAFMIPFQLHPTWRKHHRALHRISGYVFSGCAALSALGVGIIFQRNLTFVHSFPQISPVEGGFRPLAVLTVMILLTIWFSMTLFQSIRMARQRKYALHQTWIIRHVASGIWVAAQRFVLIPIYMVANLLVTAQSNNTSDVDIITPQVQRQTFNDTGLLAAIFCVCSAEYTIRRISKLKVKTSLSRQKRLD